MALAGTMLHLIVPAAVFVGIHVFVSGTALRGRLVGVLGEGAYMGLFSLVSLVVIVWMAIAYSGAPHLELWHAPALAHLAVVVMPVAVYLFIGAFTTPNPTAAGAKPGAAGLPAAGIIRVTRHPFLWAVALWALVHLLANGDVASLVFFGSLLLLAVVGPFLIDRKKARAYPEAWANLAAVTSNVPFAAIFARRTSVSLRELGWWRLAVAAVVYAAFLRFHGPVFGVTPLPAG